MMGMIQISFLFRDRMGGRRSHEIKIKGVAGGWRENARKEGKEGRVSINAGLSFLASVGQPRARKEEAISGAGNLFSKWLKSSSYIRSIEKSPGMYVQTVYSYGCVYFL